MKKITSLLILLITLTSFGQEIKFGKVSKQELEEKFYPKDSIAEAAYLFRSRKTYYKYNQNSGFNIITEAHVRIKIYNKEGFKKANEIIRYYSPDEGSRDKVHEIKGYTFNLENNKIVKSKLAKSEIFDEKLSKYYHLKKIAMPAIKEGSVIDLKYKITSPYIRNIDDLKFQFDIPVKKINYQIEHPEWFVFNKTPKGYFLVPFTNSRRSGRISFHERVRQTSRGAVGVAVTSTVQNRSIDLIYHKETYAAKDVPALRSGEPFVSSIQTYRGGMKYEISVIKYPNSIPEMLTASWEDVVKRIYKSDNFGGELNKSAFFKKDLQTLLANTSTDSEKITTILEFVKAKVKWNEYYGKYTDVSTKKAYKEGTGNVAAINLLLTSMLLEAGFKANPVLTSTRRNGIPVSPTSSGFNYVIASVTLPEGILLLDATDQYSSVNVLPFRVMNWSGRLVKQDGTSLRVPLVPKKHTSDESFISAKLFDDGTIEGMIRTKYTGLNALRYRNRNNPLKEEDVIAKLEDNYSIEIDTFKVTNDKNITKPLIRLFKFSSEDLVEGIGGKLYIEPLLFFTTETNPFKANERKYPVDFGMPWKDKYTVTIAIPEGYKVASLPEVAAIGLPDGLGLFKFQITQLSNKIKVISILQFNEGIIIPKYYQELKEFFKQIVAKQTEKIVITKS
ncbi:MAG: DUF3857 domain-containing protein [Flavobacteriaceae bacterium]|nr:MAG: DUF3857 domain-containing protein [Flavobacteriaceae bacterium]